MRPIAIIGSGIIGLITAHALRKAGYDVTLYSDRTADQWLNESRPTGTATGIASGTASVALIVEGIESARTSRAESVEVVLDELDATRKALDMADEGDVVVVCVDHANDVWKELQRREHGGASESLRAVVGVVDSDDEVDLEI